MRKDRFTIKNEKLTLVTLKMVNSDIDHKDDYDINVIMRRAFACVLTSFKFRCTLRAILDLQEHRECLDCLENW